MAKRKEPNNSFLDVGTDRPDNRQEKNVRNTAAPKGSANTAHRRMISITGGIRPEQYSGRPHERPSAESRVEKVSRRQPESIRRPEPRPQGRVVATKQAAGQRQQGSAGTVRQNSRFSGKSAGRSGMRTERFGSAKNQKPAFVEPPEPIKKSHREKPNAMDDASWKANQEERHRRRKKLFAVIFTIVIIAGAAAFGAYKIMRVKSITVVGVGNDAAANEVIKLSGIKMGTHIFNVDRETAKNNINSDPYYSYKELDYMFPNSVVLKVTERKVSAAFENNGKYVMIDAGGTVLGKRDKNAKLGCPLIYGLGKIEYEVGYEIKAADTYRYSLLKKILSGTADTKLAGTLSSIDVSKTNAVTLGTQAGMKILLGDETDLADKLKAAAAVITQLSREGKKSGTLDATSRSQVSYYAEGDTKGTDIIQ